MINKTEMISWFAMQAKYTMKIEEIYNGNYIHRINFDFNFTLENNIKESLMMVIYD